MTNAPKYPQNNTNIITGQYSVFIMAKLEPSTQQ